MTIGLNTLFLIPKKVGGTEYYTRSVIDSLVSLDKKNNYVIFCNRENYASFHFSSDKIKKILCPLNAQNRVFRILYEQLVLPFLLIKHKCNLLHSFGYFGPIFSPSKHVVTVHDANVFDHPEDVSPSQLLALRLLIILNFLTAWKIITDSKYSAKRLRTHFLSFSKKINVLYPGLSTSIDVVKNNRIIKSKYILCVSQFYPHKKVLYLLRLFKRFQNENKKAKLVLVGSEGKDAKEVTQLASSINNVTHYQRMSFEDLQLLYKQAELIVEPSIYEGFGYPVYEALQLNGNVIVGRKELYHKKIQGNLIELQFDFHTDINLITKALKKKAKPKDLSFLSYTKMSKELLKIYSSSDNSKL